MSSARRQGAGSACTGEDLVRQQVVHLPPHLVGVLHQHEVASPPRRVIVPEFHPLERPRHPARGWRLAALAPHERHRDGRHRGASWFDCSRQHLELHFDSSNIRSGPPTNATRIWVWFHSQVCTVDCTRLPANAEALRTVQRLVPSCPPTRRLDIHVFGHRETDDVTTYMATTVVAPSTSAPPRLQTRGLAGAPRIRLAKQAALKHGPWRGDGSEEGTE